MMDAKGSKMQSTARIKDVEEQDARSRKRYCQNGVSEGPVVRVSTSTSTSQVLHIPHH